MKKFIDFKRAINNRPIKNAFYIIQVIIIALSIPVLFIVEVGHKDATSSSAGIIVHNQHPQKTIAI